MRSLSTTATLILVLVIFSYSVASAVDVSEEDERRVMWIELSGYVSPATVDYVEESLRRAGEYSAVLITIDTFGGLGDSMFKIIDAILDSPVPVIGFVYPAGRQALSAGTYILLATDYAAMAPHTIIGSAQPVVGGQPTTEPKIINFLKEKMRSLAELHGRNDTQAVRFVTHNDNLGPEEALKYNVIEAIASSPEELLEKADGAVVKRLEGEVTLETRNARLVKISPGIRAQVLSVLSDPIVSSLLISLGILVLILGFTSPGFGAEIAGGIMVLLGLLGMGFNVNLVGILLALIGAGLIIYEIYSPGFGAFGIGGLISLGLGLVLLIGYPPTPIYVSEAWIQQAYITIVTVLIFIGGFLIFLIYKALKAQRRKPYLPLDYREVGRAVDDIRRGEEGYVLVAGEYWRAFAVADIKKGEKIRVVEKKDGFLVVEPILEKPA